VKSHCYAKEANSTNVSRRKFKTLGWHTSNAVAWRKSSKTRRWRHHSTTKQLSASRKMTHKVTMTAAKVNISVFKPYKTSSIVLDQLRPVHLTPLQCNARAPKCLSTEAERASIETERLVEQQKNNACKQTPTGPGSFCGLR